MNIQKMHDYFDLVQGEYDSPYFTEAEKDSFINMAQDNFVNNIIFRDILGKASVPKGPQALYGIEDTILSNEILKPIVTVDKVVTTDVAGISIAQSAIHDDLMHILNLNVSPTNPGSLTANKKLKFIRHNDTGSFYDNSFKRWKNSKPYYKIGGSFVYVLPATGVQETLLVSFLRKPIDVNISGVNCEMPSYTHTKIVAMAIELAGITTSDQALMAIDKI